MFLVPLVISIPWVTMVSPVPKDFVSVCPFGSCGFFSSFVFIVPPVPWVPHDSTGSLGSHDFPLVWFSLFLLFLDSHDSSGSLGSCGSSGSLCYSLFLEFSLFPLFLGFYGFSGFWGLIIPPVSQFPCFMSWGSYQSRQCLLIKSILTSPKDLIL